MKAVGNVKNTKIDVQVETSALDLKALAESAKPQLASVMLTESSKKGVLLDSVHKAGSFGLSGSSLPSAALSQEIRDPNQSSHAKPGSSLKR